MPEITPQTTPLNYRTSLMHRTQSLYRVTAINVSRKWIEWAEWAASLCTANSPFPGHVYSGTPRYRFWLNLRKELSPVGGSVCI